MMITHSDPGEGTSGIYKNLKTNVKDDSGKSKRLKVSSFELKEGNTSTEVVGKKLFTSGDFVTVYASGQCIWPGIIVADEHMEETGGFECLEDGYSWVYSFAEKKCIVVCDKNIFDFELTYDELCRQRKSRSTRQGLKEALTIYAILKDKPTSFDILEWANDGFPGQISKDSWPFGIHSEILTVIDEAHFYPGFKQDCDTAAPYSPINRMFAESINQTATNGISLLHNSLRKRNSKKILPEYHIKKRCQESKDRFKKGEEVFESDCDLSCLCLVCFELGGLFNHPYFIGKVCTTCKEELKSGLFATDSDGKHLCCLICSSPKCTITCKDEECLKSFCDPCLKLFLIVKDSDDWSCPICSYNTIRYIQPRLKWHNCLAELYQPLVKTSISQFLPYAKAKARVLSLYDGIGTGLLALKQLNFEIEKYYVCEIDYDSVNTTLVNNVELKDIIECIGQIEMLTQAKLKSLGRIDILIGGPPCTELSGANVNRLGLYSSSGFLVFDYYRVMKFLQRSQKTHMFWLFENVPSMATRCRQTISKFFECDPVLIDAAAFSAQKRPRLFWGNIPGLCNIFDSPGSPVVSDLIEVDTNRVSKFSKLRTITTNPNSLLQGPKKTKPIRNTLTGERDQIWITEIERVFGFPKHYTDVANASFRMRLKMLGSAWSVFVINRIFEPLKKYYITRKEMSQ
ncbi:DNA (cytosine-5)-methyltransferase 3A-like [Artemia franciscana]